MFDCRELIREKRAKPELEGEILTQTSDTVIVNSDTTLKNENGKVIAIFLKGALKHSDRLLHLEKAAPYKHNRGTAAGPIDITKMPKYVASLREKGQNDRGVNNKKNWTYYVKKDGNQSSVQISNGAFSGVAGYYEKRGRFPCREVAFTRKHMKLHQKCKCLVKEVDGHFKKVFSKAHARQYNRARKTKDYRLWKTAFSTITVNKNFVTAAHFDNGDYLRGKTCITAYVEGEDNFSGHETYFPEYDTAFNLGSGDLLIYEAHNTLHGNLPVTSWGAYKRIAGVFYLRHKLKDLCR
jgi:hypothetical protein